MSVSSTTGSQFSSISLITGTQFRLLRESSPVNYRNSSFIDYKNPVSSITENQFRFVDYRKPVLAVSFCLVDYKKTWNRPILQKHIDSINCSQVFSKCSIRYLGGGGGGIQQKKIFQFFNETLKKVCQTIIGKNILFSCGGKKHP